MTTQKRRVLDKAKTQKNCLYVSRRRDDIYEHLE